MALGSRRASLPVVFVADWFAGVFCGEGGVKGPGCRAGLGGCGGGDFSTNSGELPRLNGCGFFGFGARCRVIALRSRSASGALGGGGRLGTISILGWTNTKRG